MANLVPGSVMLVPEVPLPMVTELAQTAEALGYRRVWVPDEGLATRDVIVTLAAIAAATETIQIGTGIVNPYSRHPALTAAAIASIDELSGGRAFLGLGAGGSLTLGPLGIERPRPLRHVREAAEVARALFSGESIDYDGQTLTLSRASIDYGRPDIEIWFAGRGPKMLRQAGEIMDGVLLEFLHKPSLGDYIETVRAGAGTTGNKPSICYSTMVITNPDRIEEVRPHMTYRLVDSPQQVKDSLGITAQHTADIREAMTHGLDVAARLIPDEWVEPFVIMGSIDECASEIRSLHQDHQFDEFMLVVADMEDASTVMAEVAEVLERV
ncbi:MAG: LLM class flavin-dependent oxidoreductase [Actinobacteria bacterium]|nr:LLM class flavin-dependent oxidoreductase [Actinomycetota bacterium]